MTDVDDVTTTMTEAAAAIAVDRGLEQVTFRAVGEAVDRAASNVNKRFGTVADLRRAAALHLLATEQCEWGGLEMWVRSETDPDHPRHLPNGWPTVKPEQIAIGEAIVWLARNGVAADV